MKNGETDWIEIARAGTWTPMSGVPVTLTTDHFDRLATQFDPDDPEAAALVFGHPRTEDPAFGTVEALRSDGGRLLARFKDVPEDVKALVRSGRYRAVSPKFSPDLSRLIHVGLLGAVPPAIKGLKPIKFGGATEGVTLEFAQGEHRMDELKKALERIAALEAEIAGFKAAAAGSEDKARIAALEGEKKQAEAKAKAAEDKAAESEKAFAAYKVAEAGRAREARFEQLLDAGKVLPGDKAKVMAFAEALAAASGELEFADGSGGTVKGTKEEAYWRDLEARPDHGLLHEFAAPQGGKDKAGAIPADLTKYV